MDSGTADFEAGVYGNSLEVVMQSLVSGQTLTESQLQTETGLSTESLNLALARLQELGRVEKKGLGASGYYVAIITPPSQDWYTIDESAGYLRVSRRTMYKLINEGQLAAYRVGAGGAPQIQTGRLGAVNDTGRRWVSRCHDGGSRSGPS